MNSYIEFDMMDIAEGILIHQVNNKRVMGRGLANQIRNKYPQHYYDYVKSTLTLGSLVTTRVSLKPFYLGIIGIVAQDGYGTDKCYTSYVALQECLNKIRNMHTKYPKITFYAPMGLSCGLAGGSWDIVSKMIWDTCPFIILVKYNK